MVTVPRALIAETIDVIAVLSGRGAQRRLSELARVQGLEPWRRLPAHPLGTRVRTRTHVMIARLRRLLLSASAFALGGLIAAPAWASGSNMPWEQPLQQILDSIQGPVAKIMAVIIIIMTGLTLAFGDTSGGSRKLIQIVFGLSIAFAASSFFLSFFSFGGGALV